MSEEQISEKTREKRSKSQKSRRDVAVQGTNDNSIVSKCSMAKQGYVQDDYLQHFVSKVTRRAPLIHRGYYIRAKVIEYLVHKFLGSCDGPCQIVSLGAGYDAAYFRLHKQGLLERVTYCEVDFPDLVRRKRTLIEANPEMLSMIGPSKTDITQKSPHIELCCCQYVLLGVDLTQGPTLEAAMRLAGLTFDLPTLLLSECVLTYVHHKSASNIIRWSSEVFPNSVFLLYEQILPNDPFGLFMQKHFHTIGSPLKCLNHYPTLQAQIDRCKKQGWERVQALDMNGFYNVLLSDGDRQTVESLEPFDEHEEWHLKCAHYFVLCAHQGTVPSLLNDLDWHPDQCKCSSAPLANYLSVHHPVMTSALVKRFAHTLVVSGSSHLLVCGGFGEQQGKHQRVTEATLVDTETYETSTVPLLVDLKLVEVCRLHASATKLRDGRTLLIGGRQSPLKICSQMVAMETKPRETTQIVRTDLDSCDANSDDRNNKALNAKNISNSASNRSRRSENYECEMNDKSPVNEFTRNNTSCVHETSVSHDANTRGSHVDEAPMEIGTDNCDSKTMDTTSASQNEGLESNSSDAVNGSAVEGRSSVDVCGRGLPAVEISCSVIEQSGDIPCPRWRHTALLYQQQDTDYVLVFGGRTQSQFATQDCFCFNPATAAWTKMKTSGIVPQARHSHTADLWQGHIVIAGGLGDNLRPLTSVHLLDLSSNNWTQLDCDIEPRYSHCSHVIGDFLILIGGVNFSHNPPGVAMVHLPTGNSQEFSLPVAEKGRLLMLHNFTSHHLGNGRILLLGGGGNCFSFGTHLNASPIILNIEQAVKHMEQKIEITS